MAHWSRRVGRCPSVLCYAIRRGLRQKHAEQLFELAQPLAIIERHQAVELSFVHNDESELTAWASVASRFLPVSEVIAAVRRAKIRAVERFSDAPSEQAGPRHRYRALENIFTSLVARNAWEQLESAFDCIRSEKFFPALQASVDRQICEEYPNDKRAVGSLERLEASTLAESKSAPSPLQLANMRVARHERPGESRHLASARRDAANSD